uniref:Replication protein A 70 kDa DNA-binding subunit n=1 Tax=Ascaris suum TaxID=6253 RepID=F1KWX5_ASCSU
MSVSLPLQPAGVELWSLPKEVMICFRFIFRSVIEMSVGFVTASGKGVKVSESALEKARKLLETIDKEEVYCVEGGDAAVPSVDFSSASSFSTPIRSITTSGRLCTIRRATPFRSPAFIGPRPQNEENVGSILAEAGNAEHSDGVVPDSVTPQRVSLLSAVSTPITPATPSSSGGERRNITPIKLLTPYCKNWRLCIKVVCIEEMRQFRGTSLFSFSGVDDDGVEIRICAFNHLAEKVAALVKLDQMYYIRRASVKPTTKRFKRNQYDMEVIIRDETEIIECIDRAEISSPKIRCDFIRIRNLPKFANSEVDMMGVVREVGDVKQLTGKMGEALVKRDIQIVDDSLRSVIATLWGERAKNFDASSDVTILVFKRALVRTYHGSISLSTTGSTIVDVNADLPEVKALRRWYEGNRNASFAALSTELIFSSSEHKWIGEVKVLNKMIYFNVTAMIMNINVDNAVYKGCVNEGCRKKLLEVDGTLHCPKCGNASDDYKYFYTLSMELCDMTGTHWVSVFDDSAEKLMGESADEIAKTRSFNYDTYCAHFRALLFKTYAFRVVARRCENDSSISRERMQQKVGTSGSGSSSARVQHKTRWSVIDLMPVNYDAYIQLLGRCVQRLS